MSALIMALCAFSLAATACRVDYLSWRDTPGRMAANVIGGGAAAWPFTRALEGHADWQMVAVTALSLAWLAFSYRSAAAFRALEPSPPKANR